MSPAPSGQIRLEHGSGGALARELTEEVIYPYFRGEAFPELADAGQFRLEGFSCLTTDTYVVDPPFFPGGDIGRLAVFGTCNDLAVSGAVPQALSLALVLEEGFPIRDLHRVLESAARACSEAGVRVITGDTKVVPAGKGGGIFVNTAGVGSIVMDHPLTPGRIAPGDRVLVSAPVGAHGLAVLAAREALPVASQLRSDCASLFPLCSALGRLGAELKVMRDATRGGLAAVLNELAAGAPCGLEVEESSIPVEPVVAAASDLLGLSPLEIANEGVLVAVVGAARAGEALELVRALPLGTSAALVGSAVAGHPGRVVLRTEVGGRRILDMPRGLLLPRIC